MRKKAKVIHQSARSRYRQLAFALPYPQVAEILVLKSPRSRVIIGPLDTLVDIGAYAEKEVIQ